MTRIKACLLVLFLSVSPAAPCGGDPVLGKHKSDICSVCHGEDGNSLNPNIPKLAGQLESYIVQAVTEFQQGIRIDATMSPMINSIGSPKDLEDISAYYAAQPRMRGQGAAGDNAAEGARLFTRERCDYCHGDGGKRDAPLRQTDPPVIGGQHKAYLVKAMEDIRDARRPGDIYDFMPRMLGKLSKEQIEAIAEYLSGL